jgi:hypothetical protein
MMAICNCAVDREVFRKGQAVKELQALRPCLLEVREENLADDLVICGRSLQLSDDWRKKFPTTLPMARLEFLEQRRSADCHMLWATKKATLA